MPLDAHVTRLSLRNSWTFVEIPVFFFCQELGLRLNPVCQPIDFQLIA